MCHLGRDAAIKNDDGCHRLYRNEEAARSCQKLSWRENIPFNGWLERRAELNRVDLTTTAQHVRHPTVE